MLNTQTQLLPSGSADRPLGFSVSPVRLELRWKAEGLWQISEAIGTTRVQHGQLHRRSAHYEVTTASGVQARATSWERAIRLHFGGR